jgi:hypothetical protein
MLTGLPFPRLDFPGGTSLGIRLAIVLAISLLIARAGIHLSLALPLGSRGGLSGMGDGLWMDDPERCVAFGLTYFFLLGLFDLTIKPDPAPPAARSPGASS